MIFKVLYQVLPHEVPVRERTKAMYVEAEDVKTVRHQLNDRDFHIEHIHALDEAHLEYEKQSESFELEKF